MWEYLAGVCIRIIVIGGLFYLGHWFLIERNEIPFPAYDQKACIKWYAILFLKYLAITAVVSPVSDALKKYFE
jgi:hypothetical protein